MNFLTVFEKKLKNSLANKSLSVVFCILFIFSGFPLQLNAAPTVNELAKETIIDFHYFLEECSREERIQLIQSLRGLDIKLKDEYFGYLADLPNIQNFAKTKKEASIHYPLKPKTFNEVLPSTVSDAIDKGFLNEELISAKKIKQELLWRRYNKLNYLWHNEDKINYHYDIVKWVANKKGISKDQINSMPTYALERKVAEKYFAKIWDKLTVEQKKELLAKIEKETDSSVGDIAAIASLSTAAAIATLSTTVAFTGFLFYTTMSTVICTVAGWFGATLPFAVYMGASSTVAAIGGPIGWVVGGLLIIGGGIFLAWREVDTVAAFVMTVNAIKAKHLEKTK